MAIRRNPAEQSVGVDEMISAGDTLPGRCALCGGAENRVIFRKNGHLLRQCLGCSLVFVFPQPTDEQLAQTYSFDSGYFVPVLRNYRQLRLSYSLNLEGRPFSIQRWMYAAFFSPLAWLGPVVGAGDEVLMVASKGSEVA